MSIVHALWISKLRYGLQLCTKVSILNEDKTCGMMKGLQLTQNRLLRVLNGTKIKDKISVCSMLKKLNLLSVNQLAAQIKLVETWKIVNVEGHPLTLDPYNNYSNCNIDLRPQPNRVFNDTYKLKKSSSSFNADAARLWNLAPDTVKSALTLNTAKKGHPETCDVTSCINRICRYYQLKMAPGACVPAY